eukprot:TRINITY_DN11644_c0_g1_i2.p1 TRINITY_DN11644_c0_g1~~TRINITY_DN11644_c0_g1_i2.p1  ORF type:complete len:257 (-),score=72.86 TRINITY_DN11644_c0_g1_i2:143-913(-)
MAAALQAYVAGGIQGSQTADIVLLNVTHSVLNITRETRLSKSLTIARLKERLYPIVGTAPANMMLQLFDDAGEQIANMADDEKMLGAYGPYDYCRLHVVDMDPSAMQALNDLSAVEKYEMSDADYDKRQNTFRKFRERNPQLFENKTEEEIEAAFEEDESCIEGITVGSRCEVTPATEGDNMKKRGEVKFAGKVDFASGYWVGVQLDEPLGKNDGSVKGKKYFSCPPKYGIFARPSKVAVGDYPEEDLFGSDDDDL